MTADLDAVRLLRRPDLTTHIHCTDLELSEPVAAVPVPPEATAVRVLVRRHRDPLGFLTVTPSVGRDPARLRLAAHDAFDTVSAIRRRRRTPCGAHHLTVVVATRNRAEHVTRCLQSLRKQTYADFDVVVVDNAPSDEATAEAFRAVTEGDARFSYRRLERPGVSHARNAGTIAAPGPYVAFVDDDVRVDAHWLSAVAAAFADRPEVGCVTGLVASDSVVGPEQQYFDSRVSWASRLRPEVFGPTSDDPLHPWAAGRFGAGANMAFRTTALTELGGFDECLGPGTRALGGEDIDLFVRVLRSGRQLVYEPAALAWHTHRSEETDLRRQLFGYGVGLSAYLSKHALQPIAARQMVRQLPRAVRHILRVTKAPRQHAAVSPSAARRYRLIEFAGMALGPLYYLRSRWQTARLIRRVNSEVT